MVRSCQTVHFEIVYELGAHEEKLYAAIERFRAGFCIRADALDIMREVQRVAATVPSVYETDAWILRSIARKLRTCRRRNWIRMMSAKLHRCFQRR
jgi:hypothetical protein